jgi:hypothetical protein
MTYIKKALGTFNIYLTTPDKVNEVLKDMGEEMRDYTDRAARKECAWICSSCGGLDSNGMPDECFGKDEWCNNVIKIDKARAFCLQDGD